ncbi:NAD(P)H-hydrate dehydratase [Sphingomonas ginkgonis]|uniref:ADP-dependent (S)-NAD(P)H-hydrate dehydratase n=1 Tax=Sphingomonas ginkgonis TaxID=2315330 RepID=A0A3R9WSM4_9SPHN|nr:NAD(P)H-hydrate dehydratase [Sphingomonas ginkgonis]
MLDRDALRAHPLPVHQAGDKSAHGNLLIIAGDRSLGGAALLAARGAMRAGAGKLQVATAASHAPALGIAMPESMCVAIEESADGGFAPGELDRLAELAGKADAVVAGPGMLASDACEKLAAALLTCGAEVALDAGLLRSLPARAADSRRSDKQPILLPHAGEMAALLGCDASDVEADPLGCGRRCAGRYDAVTLVKGASSHVVAPDGGAWLYEGGAPGLGVSGSGDTLAGIVAGLLARGAEPLTALLWSVWLHGKAGRRLSDRVGPVGFLAREIVDEVPSLLREAAV